VRVTFINHSTVLIQLPGCNILTDPIWSERASPVPWAGPRRHRPPGVRLEDLPPIDVLLLSHNHYDHLDRPTLRRLTPTHTITPLGVGGIELDWWQSIDVAGLHITAVPATHFSGRDLFDRNGTLWCGYSIATAHGPVYFAGDTGFNGTPFTEMRERLGEPMLALLPIGAYKPRWIMQPMHMSPTDAADAHALLGSKHSVAIHFGTFQLTDEGECEPADDLRAALAHRDLPPFVTLDNGEALTL
jgi:L-ascorbate metabolism protein UlaG (beta-lactamase superfamily)